MAMFEKIPALHIGSKYKWVLDEDLLYASDIWPDLIVVPKGFVTDLASIPRIFRPIIPQNGKHRAAAIVHDYLVRKEGFDRGLADRIFLEAMKVLKVGRVRRKVMYWAVCLLTLFLRGKNDE